MGPFFYHLLILMVLTSAAASTQTTILPTARTALSMAVYKAIPSQFAKMHRENMIPTVATLTMGAVSAVMYAAMNYMAGGNIIADSVTAIGIFIAFYYGLTGFASAWYYRKVLTRSCRDLWMKGILPSLGGVMLYVAMGWSIWQDWDFASGNSYHLVADALLAPLVHRRRLPGLLRRRRPRRRPHADLAALRPRLLRRADAQPLHADPRARGGLTSAWPTVARPWRSSPSASSRTASAPCRGPSRGPS